ncbi:MAG TPA: carboxypeptidase-like regulatory domain-containing protein, partial [Longimicrobiales bacterium]|nr:carboxypeptidase-like regulatory domain-containing protein [Longimicrobiales bacterium]
MRTTWKVGVVTLGLVGLASVAWESPGAGPSGRVEDPSGAPAAGALVTATRPDGRTMTVYTDADGGFELPDEAGDASSWTAWLPGVGRSAAAGAEPPTALRLPASDPVGPPGSAWLAHLPDGPDTRRFILDCTGCHVTDASRVETPDGPRSREAWEDAVRMMRANFGPGTSFPIISGWSLPETVGQWAAEHLSGADPRTPPLRGPVPASGTTGAVLTEYPVPVPGDLPHDLMVDEGGTVWVTGMFTHQMYTLEP